MVKNTAGQTGRGLAGRYRWVKPWWEKQAHFIRTGLKTDLSFQHRASRDASHLFLRKLDAAVRSTRAHTCAHQQHFFCLWTASKNPLGSRRASRLVPGSESANLTPEFGVEVLRLSYGVCDDMTSVKVVSHLICCVSVFKWTSSSELTLNSKDEHAIASNLPWRIKQLQMHCLSSGSLLEVSCLPGGRYSDRKSTRAADNNNGCFPGRSARKPPPYQSGGPGTPWNMPANLVRPSWPSKAEAQKVLLTQLMGSAKPTVYSTVEVMVLWWKGYLMLSSLQKKPLW